MKIESFQNPKIKQIEKLKNKRQRDKTGQFFIEGYRECLRAYEGDIGLEMLFFCPALFLKSNEWDLINQIERKGAQIYEVSQAIFEKISMRDRPDGLALLAQQERLGLSDLEAKIQKSDCPFFCVVEAIEKPGNLGSILRSCDAVGVDGLILCNECTDVFNPNVVRSSVGALFIVPVYQVSSAEAIKLLRRHKIKIVTTSPAAKQNYTDVNYESGVAVAMGTEQLGLSDLWFEDDFEKVSIPMLGRADSLNVANATTLLLYEVLRQRR